MWLKEGFASWIEYLLVDHCFPEFDVWTQFVSTDLASALKLDALRNRYLHLSPTKQLVTNTYDYGHAMCAKCYFTPNKKNFGVKFRMFNFSLLTFGHLLCYFGQVSDKILGHCRNIHVDKVNLHLQNTD